MACTLYIVRHAEAEGNLYRRIHGWYDSLITDNGYRQIAALEERFRDIPVDAVYSSDLFRTKTTAGAICRPKGLALQTRADLRELSMGVWEDHTWGEVAHFQSEHYLRYSTCDPGWKNEGGESRQEGRRRIRAAILDIAARHPGEQVAVVCHGDIIRCLQAEVLGVPVEEMPSLGHCDNTGVTALRVEGERMELLFQNDNSHLPEECSTLARQRWWKERDGTSGDANLWFRPLNLKKEGTVYRSARHEAWQDVNGPAVPFDGDAFQRDALRCWKRAPERAVMCAMQRDETAGLLQMDLDRGAAEGVGYIPFLYMDPAHRRQGLGVQLLGQAVSTYRPLGRDRLRLCCAPDNGIAQRFYQKYGFVKVGEEPGARGPLDVLEKYIGFEAKES